MRLTANVRKFSAADCTFWKIHNRPQLIANYHLSVEISKKNQHCKEQGAGHPSPRENIYGSFTNSIVMRFFTLLGEIYPPPPPSFPSLRFPSPSFICT